MALHAYRCYDQTIARYCDVPKGFLCYGLLRKTHTEPNLRVSGKRQVEEKKRPMRRQRKALIETR